MTAARRTRPAASEHGPDAPGAANLSPSALAEPDGDGWTRPEPPVRVTRPMLVQAWRNAAFLHWPYDPAALRPHLPPRFELETFDGSAWVGLISFGMPLMRPGFLPPIPGVDRAAETHLRTYVRGADGRRGVWMLSLDIAPLPAAASGRFGFGLPYWWASTSITRRGDLARYRVRRRGVRSGHLEADLRVGAEVPDAEVTEFAHFVTARWVLYGGAGPIRTAMLVEHPRWRFRRVSVGRLDETFTAAVGLPPPDETPVVHFSDGTDSAISWPRPFRVR